MYSNLGVQRYRETDINSMSSEKMIVLLYERIVTDLKTARRALENNDRIEMIKQINHAQRIISELRSALDHSIGGEIAENLDSLYTYLFHEHLEFVLDSDPAHLDNCLKIIAPLLDAWRKIPNGTCDKAAHEKAHGVLNNQDGPKPASPQGEDSSVPRVSGESGQGPAPRKTSLLSVSA